MGLGVKLLLVVLAARALAPDPGAHAIEKAIFGRQTSLAGTGSVPSSSTPSTPPPSSTTTTTTPSLPPSTTTSTTSSPPVTTTATTTSAPTTTSEPTTTTTSTQPTSSTQDTGTSSTSPLPSISSSPSTRDSNNPDSSNGASSTDSKGTGGLLLTTTNAQGNQVTLRGSAASSAAATTTRTKPLLTTSTSKYTTSVERTRDGTTFESQVTLSTALTKTTGFSTITGQPALNSNSGGSSSGLSDENKKIIGGVVGGVGGLVVLGGIAAVLWRLYGKKSQPQPENEDDFLSGQYGRPYDQYETRENQQSVSGSGYGSPLRSPTNVGSNF